MTILNVRDALDYIRLCDGDGDLRHAVEMIDSYYTELKERHDALRASFAIEVQNAYDMTLQDRDEEITRLKERITLLTWRADRIRAAHSAHPEDENDE